MAGDWLKIQVDLPEKSEVWAIAGTLGCDPDLVVGKLIKVWRWFDAHTENGNAVSVTYALIDHVSGVTGFAEAMNYAGWLIQDGRNLVLPNFDRHNGKTAKNRVLTAQRAAVHRAKKSNVEVTMTALPKEEKKREDIKSSKSSSPRKIVGSDSADQEPIVKNNGSAKSIDQVMAQTFAKELANRN